VRKERTIEMICKSDCGYIATYINLYWLQIPHGIIVAITCDTSISKPWLACLGLNKSFLLDVVYYLIIPPFHSTIPVHISFH